MEAVMTIRDLSLDELRDEVNGVDEQIAVLASRRGMLIRAIAARKLDQGILNVESGDHAIATAREAVRRAGGDEMLVEEVYGKLARIFEDLEVSETRDHHSRHRAAAQRHD